MRISVITAFYKGSKYMQNYLRRMINNLKYLSEMDEVEVIIVNDSPDEPFTIDDISCNLQGLNSDFEINTSDNALTVEHFRSKMIFEIFTNPQNLGIHQTRVNGLKHASGEYVMFLDQDDLISKKAFAAYMSAVNHVDEVLVANASLERPDGELLWYRSAFHKMKISDFDTYCKVGTQIISPGHCVIKKSAIPDEWVNYICKKNGADDYFLWLLLLAKNVEFNYLDKVLYIHKYTGNNLSEDTKVTDESTYDFIEYLKEIPYFPKDKIRKLRRMIEYKAKFREGALLQKGMETAKNSDIFIENVEYKLITRTPYGFNR